jgi:hypothetical protein
MPKNYNLNADGTLNVREDLGTKQVDGQPREQVRAWSIPAEQIKAHVDGEAKAGGVFADMNAGDKSAALDAYNQRKQAAALDEKNR